MENLILSGAMDRWGRDRRQLLWQAGIRPSGVGELALAYPQEPVELPVLSPLQELGWEQMVTGVSPANQVMAFYRAELTRRGFLDSQALGGCTPGQRVQVAGLVVVHQAPPTAKGFHFITLEDELGMVNVVVRPRVCGRGCAAAGVRPVSPVTSSRAGIVGDRRGGKAGSRGKCGGGGVCGRGPGDDQIATLGVIRNFYHIGRPIEIHRQMIQDTSPQDRFLICRVAYNFQMGLDKRA